LQARGRHLEILAQFRARRDIRLETVHDPIHPSYSEHTRLAPGGLHAHAPGGAMSREILGHPICEITQRHKSTMGQSDKIYEH